ncbi:MAG: hypothetical protein ABIN91_23920 [Mucilaginibacter sp.]
MGGTFYFLIVDGVDLIHLGQSHFLRKRLHELRLTINMAKVRYTRYDLFMIQLI